MSHPIIYFKPIIAPFLPLKSTKGVLIGQYLVVSYAGSDPKSGYAIYNTRGRRLFPVTYTTEIVAVQQAEFINKIYDPFFPIWMEYPDADIFAWARWSVRDGHRIYEELHR